MESCLINCGPDYAWLATTHEQFMNCWPHTWPSEQTWGLVLFSVERIHSMVIIPNVGEHKLTLICDTISKFHKQEAPRMFSGKTKIMQENIKFQLQFFLSVHFPQK